MRIGIDCRVLNREEEPAGVANYTYHLAKNILVYNLGKPLGQQNEYFLFWEKEPLPDFDNLPFRSVTVGDGRKPILSAHWQTGLLIDQQNLDLVHFPAGHVPAALRTPYVVTVHDLAIFRHPEWFPQQPLSRLITPIMWKKARRLIAVSDFTKSELIELMNFDEKKIAVVYEGVAPPAAEGLSLEVNIVEGPYFIFIGTIEPRKNLDTLLDAFDLVRKDFPAFKLVVVGKEGWKCERTIARLKMAPQVAWLGYVNERDKWRLLRQATALVYPCLYEGFGLPVLESLSVRVPVIISDISPLKELFGKAAVLIKSKDKDQLAREMKNLINDKDRLVELKEKSRTVTARFNWLDAASQTVRVYQTI